MLADTLREERRKKGWDVLYLSKRSGVSRGIIEQIESGSSYYVPSEGNTKLLVEALRMPVGSLLSERDRLVERRGTEAVKERADDAGASKFVIYRALEDGYRWRLRSDTGETLAASEVSYPTKSACEADLLAFRGDRYVEAEVLDATVRGLAG